MGDDADFDLEPFEDDEEELDDTFSSDLDPEHIRIFTAADEDDSDEDMDFEAASSALPRVDLTELLEALARGEAHVSRVYGFNDLAASDLPAFASLWPRIDPELRHRTVAEAIDVAEDDYRLDLFRFLVAASEDDDSRVRLMAVSGLGQVHEPSVAHRLLDLLRDDVSDDVRAQAATSLGPFVLLAEFEDLSTELADRLATVLYAVAEDEDESWHVRRRAAESVAALGPNERVERLIDRMWQEDELGLRPSAIVAIGRGNMRHWIPVVHPFLTGDDPELRFEAVRTLGEMGDVDALPQLSEIALHEEDVDTRHEAIVAIGTIGGPTAARILSRLADQAPESDQELIEHAMMEAALEEDLPEFQ